MFSIGFDPSSPPPGNGAARHGGDAQNDAKIANYRLNHDAPRGNFGEIGIYTYRLAACG